MHITLQQPDDMPTGSQITRDVTSRLQQILKETSGNIMSSVDKSTTKKGLSYTPKVQPGNSVIGMQNATSDSWFPHGLEKLENEKTFSSQGILNRLEKSENFTQNTGQVREF